MNKKTKTILLCVSLFVLLAVSSLGIWFLTRKEPASKGNVLGVAWYDENGTEFTIDTIEELCEFAELSEHYNFSGQTIKLGADIVDNEGTATDWEDEIPEHLWKPIQNFAGTFDGQGHTISGICGYGFVYRATKTAIEYPTAGLFANTKASCVIKDFRLVNSFFYSDFNEGAGSITNAGGGTFDSIYSDATILTYKQNTGGLIGMLDARGSSTVTNCWFDGEIRVEGNFGTLTGGIVGRVCDTGGQNKIEHCLNTGTLSSTVSGRGINLGGIVGNVADSGRVTIKDCLNTGSLTNEYAISVGSVIGCVVGSANIADSYTTSDSFSKTIGATLGSTSGLPMDYDRTMLQGYGGYKWTTLDFDNYWAVVEDGTPILKYFADEVPSLDGVAKGFSLDWYDKSKTELVISNREELYGFSILSRSTDFSGKHVKLGADIVVNEGDATDWGNEAPEYNWVPIGIVDYPFAGIFDGDMHSISGLYLDTKATYAGLFSTTSEEAAIKNVKIVNSYFKSDAATFGSVVGRGRGVFETIYSNAIVTGSKTNLGGLIGQVPGDGGVIMTNCWFDGSVIHTGNSLADRRCGGLIGVMYSDTTISNCLNTGLVDASKYRTPNTNNASIVVPLAGGLVGCVGKDKNLVMNDCLNVGTIKVSDNATAGYGSVVGYVDGSVSVSDTYALDESCDLHALRNSLGGEVAVLDASTVKGYGAYQWTLLDFDKYWAVVKTGTPILKSFTSDIPSIAGVKKLYDISWYNANKKSYVIDSMEDLHGFFLLSYNTDFAGKTIKLGADIVVNTGNAATWAQNAPQYKWSPVGTNSNPFKGTFDGQMHSISGIYLKTDTMYSGLFGATTDEATIKNLRLINSYFETSAMSFGSIAGRGRGTFDTIYSNAIVVSSTGNVGGIIGQVPAESKIKVNNCWFDGRVATSGNTFNDRRVGGVIGVAYSDMTISNCLNTGIVDASKYTTPNTNNNKIIVPLAGGILGLNPKDVTATISGCLNIGKIVVNDVATAGYGPIVGYREGTMTIVDTYATPDSCDLFSGSRVNGLVTAIDSGMLKGYGAYQWTFLDFENYWAVVTESTPILKSFAGVVPSLAGIDKMIDYSWYDASKDEYVLTDAADLYGFAKLSRDTDFAGKTVKLGADIVVNKDMSNPSYVWTPIGTESKPFAGTFDGYNSKTKEIHSISGIYLKTNDRFAGLFATTSSTSVIKNFRLEDSYIETTAGDCGSIVGRGTGRMDTVKSSATIISSNARVGGLIGQAMDENFEMNNCWFAGTVTATGNEKTKRGTGGLIGYAGAKNVSVTNSLNSGTVDVTAYTLPNSATSTLVVPLAGGLIGQVYQEVNVNVSGCLNTGDVLCSAGALEGTGGYGSIIGYSEGTANVVNTYATTESCKITSGGTAKGVSGKTHQVMADSIKGYSGYQWTVLDFENYWTVVLDDEATTKQDEAGAPILKSFADKVPSVSTVDKMIDFSWMDKAEGTETDPYILTDAADLYGLATLSAESTFENKFFRLGADIVINKGNARDWKTNAPGYNWTPIGSQSKPFAGTFDGKDLETGKIHSVSGLYLNTTSRWAGLFSFTADTAKIQNLKLKNSYMKTTAADIGSIVGVGNGEFNTIYSEAMIDCSGARSGGLLGQASGTDVKMTKCWFAGALTTHTTNGQGTGGLVGIVVNGAKLTIESCYFSGTVDVSSCTDKQPYAGGMVGQVGQGGSGELILDDAFISGSLIVNAQHKAGFGAGLGMVCNKAKSTITKTYCTPASSTRTMSATGADAANNIVGATFSGAPVKTSDSVLGDSARATMPNLSWETAWETVYGTTPVLKVFKDEVIDTSWIDKAQGTESDPYILYDRADLYGLAMLSQDSTYNCFTGKFVRLGADIVVNVGDADKWSNGGPGLLWNPIGTKDLKFNGTFNGADPKTDMIHSISGIYMNTTTAFSGLFASTDADSNIQNLKLVNSYFKSTQESLGSISGVSAGIYDTIYSDAIVIAGNAKSGGFTGQYIGSKSMNNCWYAGTFTATSTSARFHGGLIGCVPGSLTLTNCLNTGKIESKYNAGTNPQAGGLIGQLTGTANITSCLNVGLVQTQVENYYGPIIGNAGGTKILNYVYATEGSVRSHFKAGLGTTEETLLYTIVDKEEIAGELAKTYTSGLGFYSEENPDGAWEIGVNTPVLKAFKHENDGSNGVN